MNGNLDATAMSKSLRIYLSLLLAFTFGWLWWNTSGLIELAKEHWKDLLGITTLYLCSHILRMSRLFLLTLDSRKNAFPLISTHALTALPSSLLPFKLGEVLRLTGFLYICDNRQKAIALWLTERFGDVLVITIFICALYLFDIRVSPDMRIIFITFLLVSGISLFGLFAVANSFIYLNRHLILTSLSKRGLLILRTSHALRNLEKSIYRSVEGRVSGFLLLSILIWIFEILALSLFIKLLSIGDTNFSELFSLGLLAGLSSSGPSTFGSYQSLALVVLTIIFMLVAWISIRLKILKI